jgi:hypothetical protein
MSNTYITNFIPSSTNINANDMVASVCTISALKTSLCSMSNLNCSSGTITNLSTLNITSTNLNSTVATLTNVSISNSTLTNLNVTNFYGSGLTQTSLLFSSLSSTNISTTNLCVVSSGFSTAPTISSFKTTGTIGGTTTGSITWIKLGSLLYINGVISGSSSTTLNQNLAFTLVLPSSFSHSLGTNVVLGGDVTPQLAGFAQNMTGMNIATASSGSNSVVITSVFSANFSTISALLWYSFIIPIL